MFYDILERKNDFLGYKNTKFEKSKHRYCSKGFSPNCQFFLGFIGQENLFMIFLNEKSPFLAIIIIGLKSRKIEIFRKGLVHGFGLKLAIFLYFFI